MIFDIHDAVGFYTYMSRDCLNKGEIKDFKYWNKVKNLYYRFYCIAQKKQLKIDMSPYSESFYALQENEYKTWGNTPENSLRISDHWNFSSNGEIHCKANVKNNNEWAICIFQNGSYHVLYELDYK